MIILKNRTKWSCEMKGIICDVVQFNSSGVSNYEKGKFDNDLWIVNILEPIFFFSKDRPEYIFLNKNIGCSILEINSFNKFEKTRLMNNHKMFQITSILSENYPCLHMSTSSGYE